MVGTFNSANEEPIVQAVNRRIDPDGFWKSEEDRFVSIQSLTRGADIIELVMTREQFEQLLNM